ncbi:MAG TPA: sulfotransferase family 2 domain-containing protein [Luteimonas sp.]
MRHVICHYHIYKNSGTTFDGMLAANFGGRHVAFDGPFPYFSIGQHELAKIIQRHPRAIAFSSHQVSLPVPSALDFNVLPVVFIRHPLLRVYSIYRFKRAEGDDTDTSRNAAGMSFEEWCRHALSHAQELTQVSNAQVRLLSRTTGQPVAGRRARDGMVYDLNQARRNLRNVDLLGRTEHFARDVSRFPALLAEYGIPFEVGDTTPRNVTASDFGKTIEERLRAVAEGLSPDTWAALQAANRQDLALYAEACERLDAAGAPEPAPSQPGAAPEGTTSSGDTSTEPSSASSSSS